MDKVELKDILNKEEFEKKFNRKNSLERSFDSDSSSWSSEDEGNGNKANPKKENDSVLTNTASSVPKKSDVVSEETLKNPTTPPAPNANVIQAKINPQELPPHLSLASVIESGQQVEKKKEIVKPDNEPKNKIPATVAVEAEVVTESFAKEEDDDWDDESHHSRGNKVLSRPQTSQPSFFQPSNTSLILEEDKDHEESKKLQKQNNVVADLLDWSPSISDMDDEKIDSDEEAVEEFDDEEEKHVDKQKVEKAQSTDKSDAKLTSDDGLSSDNEKPLATLYKSKAVEQPSATSINLLDAPTSAVKIDELPTKMQNDINANAALIGQPFEGLSPAVHLFTATSSSTTTTATPKPSQPTVSPVKSVTKSLESDIESVPSKIPSKPSSSGKRFFSRLLSTSESNESSNKQSKISLQRKSSAPAPLSALLSDTPIRLAAERRATTASVSGESVGEPETNLGGVAAKPKSFIGKMKKTLGVGKQKKSHSKSTFSAQSDPCIPIHESNSVLTIPLKGRTQDEVLIELLSQAKTFLEGKNYHGAAGDESDGHQKQPNKNSLFPRTATRLSVNSFNSRASSENR